ncbi:hypothetical protein ALC60_01220 [Trachymyrmex zeteki]|uniref:Uncharacterized protein n=1 Tax=Mycetomoellerius zeteki TaxID=64791 RepID=A0A151XHP2_9HYME|nr:hypothetical protein ALC60_01220 [Trachymyrmex zeteki]
MDLFADGSVFEGLRIIYSPFRRRVLFGFDRFTSSGRPATAAPRVGLSRIAAYNSDHHPTGGYGGGFKK